jgi:urease accessory protein UreH
MVLLTKAPDCEGAQSSNVVNVPNVSNEVGEKLWGARLRLQAHCLGQTTKVTEAYAEPPLCIRQPKNHGQVAQVYVSALGGGLLPHDHSHMHVTVGSQAKLFLGSQAANRVFKSKGTVCRQRVQGEVLPGGLLVHCPDTLTPFAHSRLHQSQTWILHPKARLCLGEVFQAGRLARQEVYALTSFRSDWRVETPDGRPILLDRISLEPGAMARGSVAVPGCLALSEVNEVNTKSMDGIIPSDFMPRVFTHWASFAFCGEGWEGFETRLDQAWRQAPVWPFGIAGPDEERRLVDHGRLTAMWRKDEKVLMARILAVSRDSLAQALQPVHQALAASDALGFSPWARKF